MLDNRSVKLITQKNRFDVWKDMKMEQIYPSVHFAFRFFFTTQTVVIAMQF